MRTILFTGKGGVGKTTIAAATGLKIAENGKRCLIISTDPAHSLSDSFDVKIGPDPVEIAKNLYGQEIDVQFELERYWGEIKNYISALFRSQGVDDIIAEELAILPGFDELASLLYLHKYSGEDEFDTIILDCAPTGETLRLLSFPEMARWYMERFFGLERKILKIVRPVAESIARVPMPTDEVMDSIESLYTKLSEIKTLLESEETTIRLVCTPEKMVIKETQRAYTYLNLFGYNVDLLVVNRVFPELDNDFLGKWKEIQQRYIGIIEESFSIPMKTVRFYSREVVGIPLLTNLAEELYGDEDPEKVYTSEKPIRIYREGKHHILSIRLPFISREEVDVMARGEELIITTGNWKRILYLPHVLWGKEPVKARYRDETLEIKFEEIRED